MDGYKDGQVRRYKSKGKWNGEEELLLQMIKSDKCKIKLPIYKEKTKATI